MSEETTPVDETPATPDVDETPAAPLELDELEPDAGDELAPSPWDELWPIGATVRYADDAAVDVLELEHRTDDGVVLRRTVARGDLLEVSPELADALDTRPDFTRES